jgi:glucose/arabinose dehydrogenase
MPIGYNAHAQEHIVSFSDGDDLPIINDPNLKVELIVQGLDLPTTMAFLGPNDILVLEKDKGTVQRIVNGKITLLLLLKDVCVELLYHKVTLA